MRIAFLMIHWHGVCSVFLLETFEETNMKRAFWTRWAWAFLMILPMLGGLGGCFYGHDDDRRDHHEERRDFDRHEEHEEFHDRR